MSTEIVDHCLELLSPHGAVRARRMFGGHGLYCDELFVALIARERLAVARGDDLVLQSWHRDQPALWDWQPLSAPAGYGLRREVLAWAWARVARTLRGAADGFAALARNAAARACRAQGCISAGDSMASAGTLQ